MFAISVSQLGDDTEEQEHEEAKVKPHMTSAQVLHCLKRQMPIVALLRGEKLGRQDRNIRIYLSNGRLAETDLKLLRAYLKLVALEFLLRCIIL